jgi:RNA-binding protein
LQILTHVDSRLRQTLKARAHALKPVVLTGQAGLSESVLAEIDRALDDHELIKVRIAGGDRDSKAEMASQASSSLRADVVQIVGHIVTLFRPRRE